MDVSENSGTPKSSILIGFSIINHPFWGTPIFGNTHIWHDTGFASLPGSGRAADGAARATFGGDSRRGKLSR